MFGCEVCFIDRPPFSQGVGGRAFQEAVGRMWMCQRSLGSLKDRVKPTSWHSTLRRSVSSFEQTRDDSKAENITAMSTSCPKGPLRILVVDDFAPFRESLCRFFQDYKSLPYPHREHTVE